MYILQDPPLVLHVANLLTDNIAGHQPGSYFPQRIYCVAAVSLEPAINRSFAHTSCCCVLHSWCHAPLFSRQHVLLLCFAFMVSCPTILSATRPVVVFCIHGVMPHYSLGHTSCCCVLHSWCHAPLFSRQHVLLLCFAFMVSCPTILSATRPVVVFCIHGVMPHYSLGNTSCCCVLHSWCHAPLFSRPHFLLLCFAFMVSCPTILSATRPVVVFCIHGVMPHYSLGNTSCCCVLHSWCHAPLFSRPHFLLLCFAFMVSCPTILSNTVVPTNKTS